MAGGDPHPEPDNNQVNRVIFITSDDLGHSIISHWIYSRPFERGWRFLNTVQLRHDIVYTGTATAKGIWQKSDVLPLQPSTANG
jgi:hypothetical protein